MSFLKKSCFYILITIAIIGGTSYFFLQFSPLFDALTDINYFDLLLSQIANTLIVLSLTSVLSTNFGQVYWVDIREAKLVEPFFSCFVAMTIYLLTALFFSFVSYLAFFHIGILISFTYATLLLMFLSYKMISIYFGRERTRAQFEVIYRQQALLAQQHNFDAYQRRINEYYHEVCQGNPIISKRILKKIERELHTNPAEHFNRFIEAQDELALYDAKIIQFTRQALNSNDTEIIHENVNLLLVSENFNTLFELIKLIFDWDHKYACTLLRECYTKKQTWLVRDSLDYFKDYALHELVYGGENLDVILNLLLVFDSANIGLSKIETSIQKMKSDFSQLEQKAFQIAANIDFDDADFKEKRKTLKQANAELDSKRRELDVNILLLLSSCSPQELRYYHVPLEEMLCAYHEGNYTVCKRFAQIILKSIQTNLHMLDTVIEFDSRSDTFEFEYSYYTEKETQILTQILNLDKHNNYIPPNLKSSLKCFSHLKLNKHTFHYLLAQQTIDAINSGILE